MKNQYFIEDIVDKLSFQDKKQVLLWAYENNYITLPFLAKMFYNYAELLDKLNLMNNDFLEKYFSNYNIQEFYFKEIGPYVVINVNDFNFKLNLYI